MAELLSMLYARAMRKEEIRNRLFSPRAHTTLSTFCGPIGGAEKHDNNYNNRAVESVPWVGLACWQSHCANFCEGVGLTLGRKTGGGSRKGRPNRVTREIRELSDPYVPAALATIVGLMRRSPDEQVRLAASREILNRRFGKPERPDRGRTTVFNTQVNFGQQQPGSPPISRQDAYSLICGGADPAVYGLLEAQQ